MGNYGSTLPPDLTVPPGAPKTWDAWGHIPMGAIKPAQQEIALSYTTGARAWGGQKPKLGPGLAADTLAFLGTDQGGLQVPGDDKIGWSYWHPAGGVTPQGSIAVSNNFEKTVSWYTSEYCTPENFPRCDMTAIAAVGDNLKYKVWGNSVPMYSADTKGMSEAVDALTHKYSTGGLDYVEYMNTKDTTEAEDPCDGPSLLDAILPVAGGLAAYIAQSKFLQPVIESMGVTPSGLFVADITSFIVGYRIGTLMTRPLGTDAKDAYYAGQDIGAAIGYAAAAYVTVGPMESPQYEVFGGYAGGVIGRYTIGLPIGSVLQNTFFLASKPMQAILGVWRSFTAMWCRWTQGIVTACDDFETFPDSRRWATSELAAKIVNELCAEEGWTKDSPQANYAMMSLITTPEWQMAANEPGKHASGYDDYAVNPLGQIVPVVFKSSRQFDTSYWNPADVLNPDNTKFSDVRTAANANAVMCQTYPALIRGDAAKNGADPMLSFRFAESINKWKEAARVKAYDPANWSEARKIPGMTFSWVKGPFKWLNIQEYLENCRKSAEEGGFDSLHERGAYAQYYGDKQPPSATDEEWMLIQCNQFIDGCANINEYYETLKRAGVTLNLCGAVNYVLIKPDDGPQLVSWWEWQEDKDESVKSCPRNANFTPPLSETGLAPKRLIKKLDPLHIRILPTLPWQLEPSDDPVTPIGDVMFPTPTKAPGHEECWDVLVSLTNAYNLGMSTGKGPEGAWFDVEQLIVKPGTIPDKCMDPATSDVALHAWTWALQICYYETYPLRFPQLAKVVVRLSDRVGVRFKPEDRTWAKQNLYTVISVLHNALVDKTLDEDPNAMAIFKNWNTGATPGGGTASKRLIGKEKPLRIHEWNPLPIDLNPSAPVGLNPAPVGLDPSLPVGLDPSLPVGLNPVPIGLDPSLPVGLDPSLPERLRPSLPVGLNPAIRKLQPGDTPVTPLGDVFIPVPAKPSPSLLPCWNDLVKLLNIYNERISTGSGAAAAWGDLQYALIGLGSLSQCAVPGQTQVATHAYLFALQTASKVSSGHSFPLLGPAVLQLSQEIGQRFLVSNRPWAKQNLYFIIGALNNAGIDSSLNSDANALATWRNWNTGAKPSGPQ